MKYKGCVSLTTLGDTPKVFHDNLIFFWRFLFCSSLFGIGIPLNDTYVYSFIYISRAKFKELFDTGGDVWSNVTRFRECRSALVLRCGELETSGVMRLKMRM